MRIGSVLSKTGDRKINVGTVSHMASMAFYKLEDPDILSFLGSIILTKKGTLQVMQAILSCWRDRLNSWSGFTVSSGDDVLNVAPATFTSDGVFLTIRQKQSHIIKPGVVLVPSETTSLINLLWDSLLCIRN